jgi:hypothetical protein
LPKANFTFAKQIFHRESDITGRQSDITIPIYRNDKLEFKVHFTKETISWQVKNGENGPGSWGLSL